MATTPLSLPLGDLAPGAHTITVEWVSGGAFAIEGASTEDASLAVTATAAAGRAQATGTLRVAQPVAGVAAGDAEATGTLRIAKVVAGTAGGDAEAAGTLLVSEPVAGTAGGQAGGSADLMQSTAAQPVAGQAGGRAGAQAAMGVQSPAAVPGVVVVHAAAAGGARASFTIPLFRLTAVDGSGVGVRVAPTGYYGAVSPDRQLAGTAAGGAGAVAAGMAQYVPVPMAAAPAAGRGGAAGDLHVDVPPVPIAGAAGGVGGAVAGPMEGRAEPLTGAAAGQAGGAATVHSEVALTGAAAGQAGGAAQASGITIPIAGEAAGQAGAASGEMTQTVPVVVTEDVSDAARARDEAREAGFREDVSDTAQSPGYHRTDDYIREPITEVVSDRAQARDAAGSTAARATEVTDAARVEDVVTQPGDVPPTPAETEQPFDRVKPVDRVEDVLTPAAVTAQGVETPSDRAKPVDRVEDTLTPASVTAQASESVEDRAKPVDRVEDAVEPATASSTQTDSASDRAKPADRVEDVLTARGTGNVEDVEDIARVIADEAVHGQAARPDLLRVRARLMAGTLFRAKLTNRRF